MEKYTIGEGISALDRVKLLMSYKESMTLKENIEIINEQSSKVVKQLFDGCVSFKNEFSKYSDINHANLAQGFINAIAGPGTDEKKIYDILLQLKDISDLCRIADIYFKTNGRTLFQDLKDDLDEQEFAKYVHAPLQNAINSTSDRLKNPPNNEKNKLEEFIKKTYPQWNVSSNDISINGNIYTIKQGDNEWDFKLVGNTFTLQQ
jgi:hypothetical protein